MLTAEVKARQISNIEAHVADISRDMPLESE